MDDFLLIESPLQALVFTAAYLGFVLKLGPRLMKNRQPFNLKVLLMIYNVSQIVINVFLFIESASLFTKINIICTAVDESDIAAITRVLNLHHRYMLLKLYDFLDTVFFVLRKNQQQITFLHVYHHVMIFMSVWATFKYFPASQHLPGNPTVLLSLWNTLVHAFMYFYYLLTSMKIKSLWWKKYITVLQLIQHYCLACANLISLLNPKCPYPRSVSFYCLFNLLLMIVLFTKFFKASYLSKKKTVDELVVKTQ